MFECLNFDCSAARVSISGTSKVWISDSWALFSLAVWGGDPVYPTINYIQDPNETIDFRGPDFHEPTPNMLAYLMEVSSVVL